jgi:twitching motility protein PilT
MLSSPPIDAETATLSAVLFHDAATAPAVVSTSDLLTRMVAAGSAVSDLILSPGRPPQIEDRGNLIPVLVPGLDALRPQDTCRIARDVVNNHSQAMAALRDHGACDVSYSLASVGRLRVNVFRQRGTYALVMRVIAQTIPTLAALGLPRSLEHIATLRNGLVLVTGPTGAGKSSTLAALIDLINETRAEHIVTIEDPIEFLHQHKKGTIHQRELHTDTPTFALALRAALRQAPKVILVGEMRDRETIDVALMAAETGHLVLSTLHTIDAARTVDRIIGAFDLSEQAQIRARLANSFQYIVSQRLVPTTDSGRMAVVEVLRSTLRTREYLEAGGAEGRGLLDAMRDSDLDGMQTFDGELERLVREGRVSMQAALTYASHPGDLRVALADLAHGSLLLESA